MASCARRGRLSCRESQATGPHRKGAPGFSSEVAPLRSVVEIRARRKATKGTVGLTTYRSARSRPARGASKPDKGVQTITFYSELLDQLSDEAATGAIVHELAHAWLNEHLSPLSSIRSETEADELARSW